MTTPDARAMSDRIHALMPRVRADLEELVRIPSVNFPDHDIAEVIRCGRACARMLRDAGAEQVDLIPSSSGVPTVRADVPGPPGSPTVMLYSHYDVQPGGDRDLWDTSPFEPVEREGRLLGRGAADDKSGVVTHIAMLRAFEGRPPVNLRILLEGEEEFGGDFEEYPEQRPELFEGVDAGLIVDVGNTALGQPTFTTQLRGIVSAVVSVRTIEGAVHSGVYGGPIPDALMVLMRLLTTLQDDEGSCAIAGVDSREWDGHEFEEAQLRELAAVPADVPLIGAGTIASRLFSRPSVNVVGIDAPTVEGAANVLIPQARARISVRVPPTTSADVAAQALTDHVRTHAPWGVKVDLEVDMIANGSMIPTGGRAYRAFERAMLTGYGRPATQQGLGGSVPFVANVLDHCEGIELLGVGAQDPMARIHAPNEGVDLRELERSIVAQALFLQEYAA